MDFQEWFEALDWKVNEVLEGIEEPPVDASWVADRYRTPVYIDEYQETRARRERDDRAGTKIYVKPDAREERMHYSVAHELGEDLMADVCRHIGIDKESLSPEWLEDMANRFASRLLCPTRWFREDAYYRDFDLLELKQRYITASHEVIAMRMLDFEEYYTAITVFDNGQVSRRQFNFGADRKLLPIETRCWHECQVTEEPAMMQNDSVRVQCWPVYEDGWKREILRTSAD